MVTILNQRTDESEYMYCKSLSDENNKTMTALSCVIVPFGQFLIRSNVIIIADVLVDRYEKIVSKATEWAVFEPKYIRVS